MSWEDIENMMHEFANRLPWANDKSAPDAQPEPDWKIYAGAIARIEESYKNCAVARNHKVNGRRSGIDRQVDVWIAATLGDNHLVTVAIECRRYGKRPVSIKDFDAFYGFLDDVGANKGVMIGCSGFTDGAQKRAEGAGIDLRTLSLEEAEEFDWDEFVKDSCQTFGDCIGTIGWHYADGKSEAGSCDSCGTFHIRCGSCGWLAFYDESRIVKCDGCAMRWELKMEKGLTCGIKELPPPGEEEGDGHEDDVEQV
jgi:hypothetical protein